MKWTIVKKHRFHELVHVCRLGITSL